MSLLRRAKGPVSRPRADRPNKKVGLMGGIRPGCVRLLSRYSDWFERLQFDRVRTLYSLESIGAKV
jgi:hypothetical protein